MTNERWIPWVLLAPCFLIILVVGLFPLLYSLWISFFDYHPTNPTAPSGFVFLDNYIAAVADPMAQAALLRTIVYTIASVGGSLVLGIGLALLLNQQLRGLSVARTLLLIPMMITPIAVGITWRIMYNPDLGVINYLLGHIGIPPPQWLSAIDQALVSIVIVDVWQWTPFMFLILFAGLRSLPRSPFEAALIDGATPWQMFRRVTLPMLRPVILLAVLLRGVDAVRTFDQIFMTTRGGPALATDLMSIFLYRINFKFFNIGYGAALSWLVLLLLTAAVMVFIRVTGFQRAARAEGAT
jgi:multiple sugar transport system permease protein